MVLTCLQGETIGHRKPRPAWMYAEDTLVQVARWMRGYHEVAAGFVPPLGAVWREGGTWSPGPDGSAGSSTPTAGQGPAAGLRGKAAAGDKPSGRLLRQAVPEAVDQALADLARFPAVACRCGFSRGGQATGRPEVGMSL